MRECLMCSLLWFKACGRERWRMIDRVERCRIALEQEENPGR